MDPNCSDLEFFDFKNVTEDEIKEIQAILKGPGSNGCVELPWEIPVKQNVIEEFPQDAGAEESVEPAVTSKSSSASLEAVGPASAPPSPPVARPPPPPVEAFIAPPTTMGPYANTPYFVSRTLPYLRAYTHMGVPFFAACPLPGAGETAPAGAPYSHFVPVVPATVAQEKCVESESGQKNRDRQFNRRSRKKPEDGGAYDQDCADGRTPDPPPVSSADRPAAVPLVPLPVPPQAFCGTLPLHGYPPGLHALPNTQLYGPQAPSAAMYYVPVFNHYGGYLPSPPSAPVVLPVGPPPDLGGEAASPTEDAGGDPEVGRASVCPVAENAPSEAEEVTDCNSSSDDPPSKSASPSPDCVSEAVATPGPENGDAGRDASRCWADLFKKPRPEVNGIDRPFPAERGRGADMVNGKLHPVPADGDVL